MEHNGSTLEERADELRDEIASLERDIADPYPQAIREKVAAYVDRVRRGNSPWTWIELADRLGVSHTTLSKWREAYAEPPSGDEPEETTMVPVQMANVGVGGEANGEADGDDLRLRVGPELVMEGLSLEQAVEAARRLR